ncbi:hypothetical protein TRIUR3_27442 [Triticum urartu]|uniref:Uncharacterized protein n=1 Tax=Triticum urartu TaxID=4572 RepID=M7ZD76_TRIUA|nr:hypothetical protein TRIUR3_27442 [Triticum urartu]
MDEQQQFNVNVKEDARADQEDTLLHLGHHTRSSFYFFRCLFMSYLCFSSIGSYCKQVNTWRGSSYEQRAVPTVAGCSSGKTSVDEGNARLFAPFSRSDPDVNKDITLAD